MYMYLMCEGCKFVVEDRRKVSMLPTVFIYMNMVMLLHDQRFCICIACWELKFGRNQMYQYIHFHCRMIRLGELIKDLINSCKKTRV